jgi:hypothetical protein
MTPTSRRLGVATVAASRHHQKGWFEMRSTTGFMAALGMLLAIPVALAFQAILGDGAETVLHLAVGTGCVLLAAAAFDFGLPRWAGWIGFVSAGAFGAIFLLQGAAGIITSDALSYVAYDVLGQELERFLPDLIIVWFLVLLAVGSDGKTRILGWVSMAVVVVAEVTAVAGAILGVDVPTSKVVFLLPFVWLLLESAKRRPGAADARRPRSNELMERPNA